MRKIISIILLCALSLFCFSGCLNPNGDETGESTSDKESETTATPSTGEPSENTTEQKKETSSIPSTDDQAEITLSPEEEAYAAALEEFFARMQNDADNSEKIRFHFQHQKEHYELKKSGKYENENWIRPLLTVTVTCNYELAVDEEWYKACSSTDLQVLSIALYDEYKSELSDDVVFNAYPFSNALYFSYDHSEATLFDTLTAFYSDYAVYKQFAELPYVTEISVTYNYSYPGSYFDE